jgi:hypothetical protein
MTLAKYQLRYELPRTHKLFYGSAYVTDSDKFAAYSVMLWSVLKLCVGAFLMVVDTYLELYIKGLQKLSEWLRKAEKCL